MATNDSETNSEALRRRLDERSDDQLLAILRDRDGEQWVAAVFPIAEEILRRRGIDVATALDRSPDTENAADEDPVVPVANFSTVVESEACRAALLGAGFKAVGSDQFVLQLDPALGPALGGFHLGVPLSEAEEARAFLAAAEAGELSAGMVECTVCGSTDVSSQRKVHRGGTFLNTLLMGPVIQDVTISFTCGSCGAKWQ